jgi:hypothetical protein
VLPTAKQLKTEIERHQAAIVPFSPRLRQARAANSNCQEIQLRQARYTAPQQGNGVVLKKHFAVGSNWEMIMCWTMPVAYPSGFCRSPSVLRPHSAAAWGAKGNLFGTTAKEGPPAPVSSRHRPLWLWDGI